MQIVNYKAGYNFARRIGYVIYTYENGQSSDWIAFSDLSENLIVLQLLQSNDKVYESRIAGELFIETGSQTQEGFEGTSRKSVQV